MPLILILLLFPVAYALGFGFLRAIRGEARLRAAVDPLFLVLLRQALGFGVMGSLGLGLAALGWFGPTQVHIAAVVLAVVGWALLWRTRRDFRLTNWRWTLSFDTVGAAGFAVLAIYMLRLCWSPALMIDSWAYHYTVPKQYLMWGHVISTPYLLPANFHFLRNFVNYWGFAFFPNDMIFPKMPEFFFLLSLGLLSAMELRRRGRPGTAWIVAALMLVTREHIEFLPGGHVDISLAGYLFFGLILLARSLAVGWRRRWPVIVAAACCFGFATGTKVNGLPVFCVTSVAYGLALLARSWKARRGRITWRVLAVPFVQPFVLGLLVGFVAAPWFLKNFLITGNPVFPFAPGFFPAKPAFVGVGQDFLDSYQRFEVVHVASIAWFRSFFATLWLIIRNCAYLDQSRVVAAFMVGLLCWLLRGHRRADGLGFLLIAGALLFPMVVLSPARRFILGPVALYLFLGASGIAELLRPWTDRHRRLAAGAVCAAWALFLPVQYRAGWEILGGVYQGEWKFDLHPYLTEQDCIEHFYSEDPAWPWVERIDREVGAEGVLLNGENIYINVLLRVRMRQTFNAHGKTILWRLAEDEHLTADQIAARLKDLEVTHIFTAERFETNPELAKLLAEHFRLIAAEGGYRLFGPAK